MPCTIQGYEISCISVHPFMDCLQSCQWINANFLIPDSSHTHFFPLSLCPITCVGDSTRPLKELKGQVGCNASVLAGWKNNQNTHYIMPIIKVGSRSCPFAAAVANPTWNHGTVYGRKHFPQGQKKKPFWSNYLLQIAVGRIQRQEDSAGGCIRIIGRCLTQNHHWSI